MSSKPLDQYRKAAVTSASPLQLVVMLYDGALRFIESGRRAMADGDLYRKNEDLVRAQKIIAELMSCLDMEKGSEIAHNLLGLYSFCYDRLVAGNLSDDPAPLAEAAQVLTELRQSWAALEEQLRTKGPVSDAA